MTVGITELPPEGMQLGGVALAGDTDRGTKTTEGLSLLFTTAGITVQGPQPQIERLLVWSALDSATCQEKLVLSDGRHAAIMELTSGGQSIRFLLPTDKVSPGQAAYLDQALPAWLSRYKGIASVPVGAHALRLEDGPASARRRHHRLPRLPRPRLRRAPRPPPAADRERPPRLRLPTRAQRPPQRVGATGPAPSRYGTGESHGTNGTNGANGTTSPGGAPPAPVDTHAAPPPPPPPRRHRDRHLLRPERPPVRQVAPPPRRRPDAPAPRSPWDGLPEEEPSLVEVEPPAQVKRSRRPFARKPKSGNVDPAVTGHLPPDAAPVDPVPLAIELPPPPSDPLAGFGAAVPVAPPDAAKPGKAPKAPKTPKPAKDKTRRRRRAATADVAAAAAAGAAVGDVVEAPPPADPAPAPPGGVLAGTGPGPATAQAPDTGTDEEAMVQDQPVGPEAGDGDAGAAARSGPNRTVVVVLLAVLLVVVLAAIGYVLTRKTTPTTPTPPPAPVVPSPPAADAALAATVNLRLTDLPAGWTRAAAPAATRTESAPPAAQVAAQRTLATCLGTTIATVSGLFGNGVLPGQTATVTSPTFQGAAGRSFQMSSRTTTLGSASQLRAFDAVLAGTNFVACFGQYQSALAAAAVPGSTAQVQPVNLPAPLGVTSFGVVTTVASPSQGTEVVGDAYILGGRVLSRLQPVTAGAPIPSGVFAPAYNAVAGRVAAAAR